MALLSALAGTRNDDVVEEHRVGIAAGVVRDLVGGVDRQDRLANLFFGDEIEIGRAGLAAVVDQDGVGLDWMAADDAELFEDRAVFASLGGDAGRVVGVEPE